MKNYENKEKKTYEWKHSKKSRADDCVTGNGEERNKERWDGWLRGRREIKQ